MRKWRRIPYNIKLRLKDMETTMALRTKSHLQIMPKNHQSYIIWWKHKLHRPYNVLNEVDKEQVSKLAAQIEKG